MREIGIKKKKQIVKEDEIGIEEFNEELVLKKPPLPCFLKEQDQVFLAPSVQRDK